MTIAQLLKETENAFIKAGISCASREALLLVCHILSADQVYVFTHKNEYVGEHLLLAAAALVNERCKGRPLAYIVGSTSFCGVEIAVDERVLIPRPETELLPLEAECFLKERIDTSPLILDMCTGSGCIACALASSFPGAYITACDISAEALKIAEYNCRKFKNISMVRSDLFERIDGSFDVIVSNPPYVAEKDRPKLQREVRDFEPFIALFAGNEGLDVIKRLVVQAPEHLAPGGLFLMEIGDLQGLSVLKLAEETGSFSSFEVKKDLAGKDRYLRCVKA